MQISIQQRGPAEITRLQQLFEREGARSFYVPVDFSVDLVQELDVSKLVGERQLSAVKTIYIDNADNTSALIITFPDTQQRIIAPPATQGYYAVMIGQNPRMQLISGVAAAVQLLLINIVMDQNIWSVDNPSVIEVEELATDATDRSGSIAVAATSQSVMAANTLRHEAWVANPSALNESLFINITGGAAVINGQGSIEIPPGTGWAGNVTDAIAVIAATAGHVYTAGER